MSGLFDSLTSAQSALTASRMGLDVAGQNIANINTPGYSRRTLLLAEVPASDRLNAGRGVEVQGVRALRDQFVQARMRREQQASAHDSALVDTLSTVEGSIGQPGQSLDARLTAFFDSFAQLADDVTSPAARDGVLQQGRNLSAAFNDLAGQFLAARGDADQSARGAAADVNALAAKVAALNAQISTNGTEVESLRDQRDVALETLAQLADVSVLARSDGQVDVTIGSGKLLVVGTTSYQLTTTSTGPNGFAAFSVGGADITSQITGGRIGGLLAARDTVIPGFEARLDQLAYDVATQVNLAHNAGFDANGNAAGDFFTAPAAVAGAAAAMAVDPAVDADVNLIAGSGTGAAGDNQAARALAGLRDSQVMLGGTATAAEAWSQLVYSVGTTSGGAKASATSHGQIIQQLSQLRDQSSGVSLDEEAAHLMRYQRSYEASARYFSTIVDTIDALLAMVH